MSASVRIRVDREQTKASPRRVTKPQSPLTLPVAVVTVAASDVVTSYAMPADFRSTVALDLEGSVLRGRKVP